MPCFGAFRACPVVAKRPNLVRRFGGGGLSDMAAAVIIGELGAVDLEGGGVSGYISWFARKVSLRPVRMTQHRLFIDHGPHADPAWAGRPG